MRSCEMLMLEGIEVIPQLIRYLQAERMEYSSYGRER